MDRQRARYAVDPNWKRDYHAANRERENARLRDSRSARVAIDPAYRKVLLGKKRRENTTAYNRTRYAERKEAYAAAYKRYVASHPEAMAVKYARRRSAFLSVNNTLTARDVADVFAEFNHACAYCLRTDRKLTVDHMEPVSKGGDNTRANIVPACLSCNSSKGDRSIFWMLNR
jgi:5-methylcytosine-specific restriction endonuclease McrA